MNCAEFRERLLTDPHDPALRQAAEDGVCPDAQLQLARAIAFERKLRLALEVPLPAGLEQQILATVGAARRQERRGARRTWMAFAASLGLGVIAAGWWLRADPGQGFVEACVDHLRHEPYAITRTRTVPEALVARMFREAGIQPRGELPAVQYSTPCPIGRYESLHMVAQQAGGPVTVLYVSDPPDLARRDFRERAITGRIVPLGQGALVLMGEHSRDFDSVEQGFRSAIEGPRMAAGGI